MYTRAPNPGWPGVFPSDHRPASAPKGCRNSGSLRGGRRVQPYLFGPQPPAHLHELSFRLRQPPVAIIEPRLPLVELRLARQHALCLLLAIAKRPLALVQLRGGGCDPRAALVQSCRRAVEVRTLLVERTFLLRELTEVQFRGAEVALTMRQPRLGDRRLRRTLVQLLLDPRELLLRRGSLDLTIRDLAFAGGDGRELRLQLGRKRIDLLPSLCEIRRASVELGGAPVELRRERSLQPLALPNVVEPSRQLFGPRLQIANLPLPRLECRLGGRDPLAPLLELRRACGERPLALRKRCLTRADPLQPRVGLGNFRFARSQCAAGCVDCPLSSPQLGVRLLVTRSSCCELRGQLFESRRTLVDLRRPPRDGVVQLPLPLGQCRPSVGELPIVGHAGIFAAGDDPPVNRFADALVYATQIHEAQRRKGTDIPYVAHLLAVASLVLEDGGDEDEAIAALLHDAIEDTDVAVADLETRFGPKVASIVQGCSDADLMPKPPWRERKEAYIAHLEDAPPEVVRVSLADKVHNARSVLFDYRLMGEELWTRFNPDADQLWYYRSLVDVFSRVSHSPLVDELERVVGELERLRAAS
jgi:HD domain